MTDIQQPSAHDEDDFDDHEPTRVEEEGESDEPDAPTATEENIGMNTILGHGLFSGIQEDLSDE